jgi:hypothetical protein
MGNPTSRVGGPAASRGVEKRVVYATAGVAKADRDELDEESE